MGVSNHGLHCQHGLYLEGNRAYAGYTYMRAQKRAAGGGGSANSDELEVEVTLEDTRTGGILASQTLRVPYGRRWVRLELRLRTGATGSECGGVQRPDAQSGTQWLSQCSGVLVMALRSPGTLDVDFTYLSPEAWGLVPGVVCVWVCVWAQWEAEWRRRESAKRIEWCRDGVEDQGGVAVSRVSPRDRERVEPQSIRTTHLSEIASSLFSINTPAAKRIERWSDGSSKTQWSVSWGVKCTPGRDNRFVSFGKPSSPV